MGVALCSRRFRECDLSVNNLLPVYNTRLLRLYGELDPRLIAYVREFKAFAMRENVHGARHQGAPLGKFVVRSLWRANPCLSISAL